MKKRFAICASLCMLTAPVWAQSSEADSENGTETEQVVELERVVVVATRTERPQFTTPAAISGINREQIDTAQAYGFQDLLEGDTSVSIQGGPRRIAEEPSIRGFSDEQVAIRIDGTRQNFNRAHGGRFLTDPDLIRSIEILRGASSAIYGSGALGGVMAIETVDGRDLSGGVPGIGGRVRLGYQSNGDEIASYNTLYGQGGLFDFVASYVYRDVREDLQDGEGNDILSTQDKISTGFLKMGFEPTLFQRLELSIDTFENEGNNPTNANQVATPTNLVDRETDRNKLRLHYEYDNPATPLLNLNAVVYRNEIDTVEFRFDDDRIDRTLFDTSGFELYNTSRFEAGLADEVVLTYGVEAYRDEQSGLRNSVARPQFPDAEADYSAVYAQAEIPLTSTISLIPGVRYDEFEYDAVGFDDRDESKLSPKLAVGFQPTASVYLWADYSEAFRAPSLTELFVDGVHFIAPVGPGQVVINEFIPSPDLEPEEVEQYQLGARFQRNDLFGSNADLSLDLVYFNSSIKNFVEERVTFISGPPTFDPFTQTLIFPGFTTNSNVDADITGFEFDARLESRRAYLRASFTLLDSEQKDNGQALANVQPDQASVSAGLYAMDRQLTLGTQLTASRARNDVPEDVLPTAGWGKTDVFVRYQPNAGALDGFDFRFTVDNLFDKEYRVHPNGINQPGLSLRFSVGYSFGPYSR